MEYEAIIGMEVHAQLLTRSKMFCACAADYAAAPFSRTQEQSARRAGHFPSLSGYRAATCRT